VGTRQRHALGSSWFCTSDQEIGVSLNPEPNLDLLSLFPSDHPQHGSGHYVYFASILPFHVSALQNTFLAPVVNRSFGLRLNRLPPPAR
jgi:hypothetical protein